MGIGNKPMGLGELVFYLAEGEIYENAPCHSVFYLIELGSIKIDFVSVSWSLP